MEVGYDEYDNGAAGKGREEGRGPLVGVLGIGNNS